MQNAVYSNDTLTYTSGNLELTRAPGYQVSTTNRKNITFVLSTRINYFVGDGDDLEGYLTKVNNGAIFAFNVGGQVVNVADGQGVMAANLNDVFNIELSNSSVKITNVTTGATWTSPQSIHLEKPPRMGIFVPSTNSLNIKSL